MSFSFLSMWKYKCPRCRKGDIFEKPFKLSDPLKMPHSCEYCGQKMEPEPGYYYGAMFLSYIAYSLFMLPIALALVFLVGLSIELSIVLVILFSVLFFFRILRGSRSLWIHMMVRYNPNAEAQFQKRKTDSGQA